jgi:hypothetical protein
VPDEPQKGIIDIQTKPATGVEPAQVSVYIDGDHRFTVRTDDLENIGSQLRGKKDFSFFNSVGLPILISLLTVIGTTVVGQVLQYVSWRNSTRLQTATLAAQRAVSTFQKASLAIDKRYYATFLYLGAARDLVNHKTVAADDLHKLNSDLDQQRYNAFYVQLKSWNENYDQTLSAIDYTLDVPSGLEGTALSKHERVSYYDFANKDTEETPKINCGTGLLVSELRRLQLNVNSIKVQFAALNYCFMLSTKEFNSWRDKALSDDSAVIPDDVKAKAALLNDGVRRMSDEFRCFAQHRIAFLEQRKQTSIFRPFMWIYDRTLGIFAAHTDPAAKHVAATLKDCDLSKPASAANTSAPSVAAR